MSACTTFNRLTAPAEDYPDVNKFLFDGFEAITDLLAGLEGTPWFAKVIDAPREQIVVENWTDHTDTVDAWHSIVDSRGAPSISSMGSIGDGSGASDFGDSSFGSGGGYSGFYSRVEARCGA